MWRQSRRRERTASSQNGLPQSGLLPLDRVRAGFGAMGQPGRLTRALRVALVFTLSATLAQAQTQIASRIKMGPATCDQPLSDPASERNGENWLYG